VCPGALLRHSTTCQAVGRVNRRRRANRQGSYQGWNRYTYVHVLGVVGEAEAAEALYSPCPTILCSNDWSTCSPK
jgi:hypothetical protein